MFAEASDRALLVTDTHALNGEGHDVGCARSGLRKALHRSRGLKRRVIGSRLTDQGRIWWHRWLLNGFHRGSRPVVNRVRPKKDFTAVRLRRPCGVPPGTDGGVPLGPCDDG
jgi:hypothetical protein